MKKNDFLRQLAAAFILAWFSLAANAELQPGKDYKLVSPPQSVETGKKIEVLEVFYYGCSHCFDLEPVIVPWIKRLPRDVAFRRMPAAIRDSWVPLAKAFYAAEALNAVDKLHADMFNDIHVQDLNLGDEAVLFDWVAKHGVDRKRFSDAYASFAVQSKVQRAMQMTRAYGVTGVPSVVVDGKYLTSPAMVGSLEGLLPVLDQLIAKARRERR